jgi:hypothetical protein
MTASRDMRHRTLPFSKRTYCSIEDAAAALGITLAQVRTLVADGALRALADGRIDPKSVLEALRNLSPGELRGEL